MTPYEIIMIVIAIMTLLKKISPEKEAAEGRKISILKKSLKV